MADSRDKMQGLVFHHVEMSDMEKLLQDSITNALKPIDLYNWWPKTSDTLSQVICNFIASFTGDTFFFCILG